MASVRLGRLPGLCAAVLICAMAPARAQDALPGRIVFDGDSVSAGVGASPGQGPDRQLAALLRRPADIRNVAVSGQPVFTALARYDQAVRPLYDAGAPFHVIAFHAGDNDITAGRTAADAYASFTRYVAEAHAQGWKVVVSTELQRTAWPPAQQAELSEYNRLLEANRAGADAVVGYDAAPGMSDPARRRDPAYFAADGIHPSDGGYAILARMLAGALGRLGVD